MEISNKDFKYNCSWIGTKLAEKKYEDRLNQLKQAGLQRLIFCYNKILPPSLIAVLENEQILEVVASQKESYCLGHSHPFYVYAEYDKKVFLTPKALEQFQKLRDNDTKLKVIKAEVAKLLVDVSALYKDIRCILDEISTVKQLKQEFPEAYEVLYELIQGKRPKCDSVEEVRAKLKSSKK